MIPASGYLYGYCYVVELNVYAGNLIIFLHMDMVMILQPLFDDAVKRFV